MRRKTLNRIGFALLGLTNNYGYVIMLSAAFDLLQKFSNKVHVDTNNQTNSFTVNATTPNTTNVTTHHQYCNKHGTSTILLADTMPSLIIKLIYPFFIVNLPIAIRVHAAILSAIISFLIVGLANSEALIFIGVAFASFSSGVGESTYLSITPLYGDVVSLSGWSIGTGFAGILGASVYSLLAMILSVETIMLVMIVVPLIMALSFFVIIDKDYQDCKSALSSNETSSLTQNETSPKRSSNLKQQAINNTVIEVHDTDTSSNISKDDSTTDLKQATTSAETVQTKEEEEVELKLLEKICLLPGLLKYFLPLLIVYFAEYFINQGIFELMYYPEITYLDHNAQYRWFSVIYQVGVFVSRSSIELFQLKSTWTMAVLQVINMIVLLLHTIKVFHIPSFYIVCTIILYEGFLGGFAYVNTYYRLTNELPGRIKEFAITAVTIADSLGIVIAAFSAMPTHSIICETFYQD